MTKDKALEIHYMKLKPSTGRCNCIECAMQLQQKPVAVRQSNGEIYVLGSALVPIGALLYTSPPQLKPLTDEQIDAVMPQPTEFGIVQPPWNGLDITILRAMARAIEATHGIKENT